MIELPDTIKHLYLFGPINEFWKGALFQMKTNNVQDAVVIFCGDFGIGFKPLEFYTNEFIKTIEKELQTRNIIWLILRGNHDDPKYFQQKLINTDYVKCIPDYTVVKYFDHNILCVGGAITSSRKFRIKKNTEKIATYMKYYKCSEEEAKKNTTAIYWPDEQIVYKPKVSENIDIICTHSAPSFSYPVDISPTAIQDIKEDPALYKDIKDERKALDMVYEDYQDTVKYWYYSHFYGRHSETIDGTMFRLLDTYELTQHLYDIL